MFPDELWFELLGWYASTIYRDRARYDGQVHCDVCLYD